MNSLKSGLPAPPGVLLVNLGSPARPTAAAVQEFLEQFLSDPLVVDWPAWLWSPLRRKLVLPRRSAPVARLYEQIWTEHGSPLVAHTKLQSLLLQRELGSAYRVEWGMRYGEPSIESGLSRLVDHGCASVVLLPLFPQSSRTTTGTVMLEATRAAARLERPPRLTPVDAFATHPGFVQAWAERIEAARGRIQASEPQIVLSFHGLPERYVRAGDPYRDHCEASAKAIAHALRLRPGSWSMAYQSKFGPGRWLGPATLDLVTGLARRKLPVVVAAPAFVSDCLETLEELDVQLRQSFRAAGGGEFQLAACLNASPTWIRALAELVRELPPAAAAR